jgi:hippurate hydrolase
MKNRASELLRLATAQAPENIAVRRDIHQHPELAYDEHRTSEIVAERLKAWGYDVETGLGGTGVVGRLVRGGGTRRVGLRADMDALPIHEATGLDYASVHTGVMHACGHDGHTAMLLGAARLLAQEGQFSGVLNLIFQPAEEGGGGAKRMMDEGLFERYPCDAIFAMHNVPGFEPGHLVFRDGPALASADDVVLKLTGMGGHGATPHKTVDPIVAAASIVMALQTVVSRNIDPLQMAVVTVGMLVAGQASNIIPKTAMLKLTVRTLDRDVHALVEQRIREIVQAQAQSFGVQAEIEWCRGYPVLINTLAETELARKVGTELLGEVGVTRQGPAIAAAEDFAFMLEQVPGSYVSIGNGISANACLQLHNAEYDFNDENVAIGTAYWTLLAERFLQDVSLAS